MSVDGMRQTMEEVQLGSAEPIEDEEGSSALPSGDLRLDLDSGDSESGECGMDQQDDGDGESEDDCVVREIILIDDDEEAEEEDEYRSAFADLEGATLDDGDAKTETKASEADPDDEEGKAQTQSYALLMEAIFDRLRAKNEVVARVTAGGKKGCTGHKSHLATLAANLLGLAVVQTFVVWNWWEFLKRTLLKNAAAPPTSVRAAKYTKERRDEREETRSKFICHDDIRSVATALPEGRVNRDFVGVFLVIENVIEETLTQALYDSNFVKVTYPMFPSDLDVNQKRTVYSTTLWAGC